MSEHDRRRRLHVQNRLLELRTKHGSDLEAGDMPAWLDTYQGLVASRQVPPQSQTKPDRKPDNRRPVRIDV